MTIPSFEELMGQDTTRRTMSGSIPSFDDLMERNERSLFGMTYTEDEEARYAEEARIIGNRVKNISRLITGAANLLQNRPDPSLVQAFTEGQKMSIEGNQLVKRDIANMFSQADIKETLRGLWEGGIERVRTKKMETLGALFDIPAAIVESLVGDTFAAITGVGLGGEEVKALTPEEYAHSTKIFIGNAIAAVVAPATSKLVEASFAIPATKALGAIPTTSNIASASLAQQSALGNVTPVLGKLGRAIIDDVTAGAMSGMAQGAIANANTPDTYAAAATGLLFAPVGVVTGWYRGVKGTGTLEDAITQAKDISLIRQWQELGSANIESAAKRVEALLTSDDIAQAVGKSTTPQSPLTTIDDLWNDFKTHLTEEESFASSLVRYAEEKKLTPHINEMLEKFATKFVEENVDKAEVAHLNTLIEDNRKEMGGKFPEESHGDIIDIATRHGFFITNEFGKLKIRDIDSGEIVGTANTSQEAIAIMRETGTPANPIKMDAGANFSGGVPTPPVAPSINPHMGDEFEPVTNNWQKRVTAFDAGRAQNITSMNAFIEAMDLHFGTNLKHQVFEPLERSHRMTTNAIRTDLESGRVQLVSALARKMKPEQLEQVGMALESQSFDEILAPNGYSQGFTVSPQAAQIAKFAHQNNIDLTKVLYFRRAQSAIRYYFNNQAEKTAFEQMKLNKQIGMSTSEASQIFDDAVASVDQNPDFLAMMDKLFQTFSPEQNFIKTAGMLDDLFKAPDGAANSAATVRLKLALDHPDTHGLSRNDFVSRYLKSDQVTLLERVEDAYKYFGDRFGIPDARMINRYMNHYRQFGDILDSYVIGDFERGIMDGAMRQFVSAMIRTGEVGQYSMNPVLNLTSYIRGGNKSQIIYRALEKILNKTDSTVFKELARINDPVARNMVKDRLNNYQRDIIGQYSIGDTEAMHIQAKMLSNLALDDNGRRMTTQEIVTQMQRPDHVDTFMALSTSGLLGGRISLALRDKYDVIQKFYVKYGAKRLGQLMMTRVDKKGIEYLIETGEITKPDPIDIYNVTYTQGKSGTVGRAAKELADLGFRTSLQGHFYMKNQAAVYVHSMRHVGKVLNDLDTKKLSREAAYQAVDLNRFDVATQRMFDAYVRDGNHESAARLLARQDVREMVGTFSRGNQAPVLNTKIGKIFGQLGSWGMTNRSVLQNLLTRGTKRDIATANIRYATALTATVLAGRATGLNLGRWLLLPTSVIATGGPMLSMAESLQSEAASELGSSEKQTRFTRRTLTRSLLQFVPFSMAIRDIKKATELQTQGQGFGAGRTAAQAIGVPVNTEDRSFLDWVIGNYPVKWEQ